MISIVYVVVGILFILVPHFLLPMDFLAGGRDSWLLAECSVWYHPESFIGMAIILAGLFAIKYKKAAYSLFFLAILGVIQGLILKPTSFFTRINENLLVILGQTISLRTHAHIQPVILGLSVILLAAILGQFYLSRKSERRQINFLTLPMANIRRKSFRSAALVMALAVVVGAFFADVLLTRSIGNTLELGVGRLGADLVVVPKGYEEAAKKVLLTGEPSIFSMPASINDRLQELPEIDKTSPQLLFRPFSYLVCCTTEKVLMIGYDPDTDFTIGPWVNYFLRQKQDEDQIVVGAQVKLYPGHKVSLFGHLISVVASLDATGIGYFDTTAFIPMTGARKLIRSLKKNQADSKLHKRKEMADLSLAHLFDKEEEQTEELSELDAEGISTVFVKVKDNVDVKALAKKISKTIDGVAVVNVKSATVSIKRQLTSMLDAFFLPIIIMIFMGTVILAAIFSMSANERRREVGMLRAMGATKLRVFQLFLAESLIVAGLGGIFGILSGAALLLLFKNRIMASLHLLYIWPSPMTALEVSMATLCIAVIIGILAGLYPALKAARLEPYQAIRGGR